MPTHYPVGCCGFAPSGCIAPGGRSNVQDLFSDLVSAGVWDDIDFISGHIYNDNPTKADTCIDSLRSSARDATSGVARGGPKTIYAGIGLSRVVVVDVPADEIDVIPDARTYEVGEQVLYVGSSPGGYAAAWSKSAASNRVVGGH